MSEYAAFKTQSALETRTYSLQVLTPLLMHGWQDSTKKPLQAEVRVASLKGVMRYWWRALQLDMEPAQLLAKEIRTFGGVAADGEDGRRSPFVLRLDEPVNSLQKTEVLVHRGSKKGASLGIPVGTRFQLHLHMYQKQKAQIERYDSIIRLAFVLGQFGQRARRGFGSLQVEDMRWETREQFWKQLLELSNKVNPAFLKEQNDTVDWNGPICLTAQETATRHPILRSLYMGGKCESAAKATYKLSRAGHCANTIAVGQPLGSSKPGGRMASPLLGKVIQIGDSFYPLVVEVHKGKSPNKNSPYQTAKKKFYESCQ